MSSYAAISDLNKYLEGFATNYYGNSANQAGTVEIGTVELQADLDASFSRVNYELDAIGRIPIVPVGTNPKTGSYHPALIEWNCLDTIELKLKARHASEFRDKFPDWMDYYGSRRNAIFTDIVSGRIVLDTDTTTRGIGYPVPVTKLGFATLYTNWNFGFYRATDYPKIFHVRINGTADGNDIGEAEFEISEDDGYSYLATTCDTGTNWIDMENGLWIRWSPGTLTGTRRQLEYHDEWKITCIPSNIRTVGYQSTFKTFGRG